MASIVFVGGGDGDYEMLTGRAGPGWLDRPFPGPTRPGFVGTASV
jgi:hypothetical protein